MDIMHAKQKICETGMKLVEEGLVARTWGNLSIRIDDHQMVITPSGRTYEELSPEDIVVVSIDDLSYDTHIKPSSEKGLHAQVYKQRSDINAVIHTHQRNASSVASARKDIPVELPTHQEIFGNWVRCSGYALPGMKKLSKAAVKAIGDGKAALLANHGAVCIGNTMEEAFQVALRLEELCQLFIEKQFMQFAHLSGDFDVQTMHEYYLSLINKE
jgi:L-fuculose-phosphate aldolase